MSSELPSWFEHGRSSQNMTHEQIVKLARKKKVLVGLTGRQTELRQKCDQLVGAGMLRRLNENTYIIR